MFPSRLPALAGGVAGTLSALLGTAVLVGWLAGVETLQRIFPGFTHMHPLSAAAFLVAGCGFLLLAAARFERTIDALAGLTAFLGILMAGWNLRCRWTGAPEGAFPEGASLAAGVCFLGIGWSLWEIRRSAAGKQPPLRIAVIGCGIFMLGMVGFCSYLFGAPAGDFWGVSARMSVHGAAARAVLGLSIVACGLPRRSADEWEIGEFRRTLVTYTALGGITLAVVSSALTMIPFSMGLQEAARTSLLQTAGAKAEILEQMVAFARGVAQQGAARTEGRRILEEHNRGGIPPRDASSRTRRLLQDAVSGSDSLLGVVRQDARGKALAAAGTPPPAEHVAREAAGKKVPVVKGPFLHDRDWCVAVSVPVLGKGGAWLGSDLALIRLPGLQALLKDRSGLGSMGRVSLACLDGVGGATLISEDEAGRLAAGSVRKGSGLDATLSACVGQGAARVDPFPRESSRLMTAASPIPGTGWAVVSQMAGDEITARVRDQLRYVGAAALVVTLFGVGGIFLLIRPFTGRVLVRAEDLARQKKELETANARLEVLVNVDPLTELLNRRGLEEVLSREVARIRREGGDLVVVLADLDNFKRINDSLGHAAGDLALREVGRRLRDTLRERDCVARIGGDEFMVLLPDTRMEEGKLVAEKLRAALAEASVPSPAGEVAVTASLGMISVQPATASIDELLSLTHLVLYESKHNGKNRVSWHEERAAGGAIPDPLSRILEKLRSGEVFYTVRMPVIRLSDGEATGYEFFGRSRIGVFEMPVDFFRISHEAEILTLVDHHCFRACARVSAGVDPRLERHLNLFPSTLLAIPPEDLLASLPEDLPRERFLIEISEQRILEDPARLAPAIAALRAGGVRIGIDDVGFGKSSLESLVDLEPDVIKIDAHFIRGIGGDARMQRALARLLRSVRALDARIIAEGIESEEDVAVLQEMGVAYGQGFLWGRPV